MIDNIKTWVYNLTHWQSQKCPHCHTDMSYKTARKNWDVWQCRNSQCWSANFGVIVRNKFTLF